MQQRHWSVNILRRIYINGREDIFKQQTPKV